MEISKITEIGQILCQIREVEEFIQYAERIFQPNEELNDTMVLMGSMGDGWVQQVEGSDRELRKQYGQDHEIGMHMIYKGTKAHTKEMKIPFQVSGRVLKAVCVEMKLELIELKKDLERLKNELSNETGEDQQGES